MPLNLRVFRLHIHTRPFALDIRFGRTVGGQAVKEDHFMDLVRWTEGPKVYEGQLSISLSNNIDYADERLIEG